MTFQRPGILIVHVIDAHSKWLEVHPMPMVRAQSTMQCLRGIFAQFVLTERVLLDNGEDQPLSGGNLRIFCLRMGLSM